MVPALALQPSSNILQSFYRKLLLKIKVNYNVLLALIPIPSHLGGFNLRTLKIEQYIESIEIVISYFNSCLPTSKLLRQSLEYMQLESGLDVPVLLSSYKDFRILCTEGWLKSL